MNKSIAILEDEPDILELLTLHLCKNSFNVNGFLTAFDFYKYIETNTPDMFILDLMLPDADGLQVSRDIQRIPRLQNVPIIFLTAKSEEFDKVIGLEMGADDYITKPFSTKELIARIKAIFRRINRSSQEPINNDILIINDTLKLDLKKMEVFVNDEKILLTTTEFRLLKLLSQRKGWVFSRNQILDYLWGNDKIVLDRTIDVHIKNLREKLLDAGKYIKNIRGVGYKLEE